MDLRTSFMQIWFGAMVYLMVYFAALYLLVYRKA